MEIKNVLGVDFETFYSTKEKYSLGSKAMTTQMYIEDPRFEVIGVAIGGVETNSPIWTPGKATNVLNLVNWDETIMLAHNAQFDGSILDEHYGIQPKYVLCTMAMCQTLGLGKIGGGVSLAAMARFFGLQAKGTEVANANGKRLRDFTPPELRAYGRYCAGDVKIMNGIFNIILPYIDAEELAWHSLVNKAFTEPQCRLNTDTLLREKERVLERDLEIQSAAAAVVGTSVDKLGVTLRSNQKFAELLQHYNVPVPMKISPTTGKETFAFAKKDHGFIELLESEDPEVSCIARARLGAKSSQELTRIEKLLGISRLPSKRLRMPMKISGAHTHRASGSDGLNVQNWPSGRVEGQSKAMRGSIEALDGEQLTAPDSGQIEARILAAIADDTEILEMFSNGECPYSAMAELIYKVDRHDIKRKAALYGETKDKQYFEFYMMRQTGKAAILQLGYQAGEKGFYVSLTGTYRVTTVAEDQAGHIVNVYRRNRKKVVQLWEECERVIQSMINGGSGYFGGADGKMFYYNGQQDWFGHVVPSIRLPNNTWLTYPNLCKVKGDDDWKAQVVYIQDMRKFRGSLAKGISRKETLLKQGKRLYGGSLTENLCQALAFAALKWQALRMDGKFLFNVHDEHIMVAKTMGEALEYQKHMMETPPYLEGLKFDCDFALAKNYAEC